jgi:mannose-6-phosphate isomerase
MIVICLEGLGKLKDSEGNVVALKQGETVLVPAVTDEITFIPQSQLKVLTSWI